MTMMMKRKRKVRDFSRYELDYLRYMTWVIDMADGAEIEIRAKGDQLEITAGRKALSVEPRAANQIRIGLIDPYDRD